MPYRESFIAERVDQQMAEPLGLVGADAELRAALPLAEIVFVGGSHNTNKFLFKDMGYDSSRWVAIPVGHVSRWHWRAMSQPIATMSSSGSITSPLPLTR